MVISSRGGQALGNPRQQAGLGEVQRRVHANDVARFVGIAADELGDPLLAVPDLTEGEENSFCRC